MEMVVVMYDIFNNVWEEEQTLDHMTFQKWKVQFVEQYEYEPEDWEVDEYIHEKTQQFWDDQVFYMER